MKSIPVLRFKEFSDQWSLYKLSEVSSFLDGRRKPIKEVDRMKMQGKYPYYGASGIIDYIDKFLFDEEIILLGEDGENIVSRNLPLAFKVTGKCWVNNHAHVIKANRGTDIDFLTIVLERQNYEKYNTGTAQPKLNQEVCKSITFHLPSLPEQQKIASFLSAVDEKIRQLKRKKEFLEQYKKGVMQQIFERKIRFKDEKGKAFPEWEEKRLGEVATNVSYGLNAAAIAYDGKHKYLRITDIDENSNQFVPSPLTSPDGVVDEAYKLKVGDIVFARTGASVGKTYVYSEKDGDLYFAGFLIRFAIIGNDPYFIFHQTLQASYRKWVLVNSMRSGQPGLNAEELKSFVVKLPCLAEQQKIASFLSSLDKKIELVSQQVEKAREFKKGLLQQMFV